MRGRRRIPLWAKLACSAFVAVMVPAYLRQYGPVNFLFFCDVALLVATAGLWLEQPLLLGMEAVAILVPQTVWIVDLLCHCCGLHGIGMTDYMFNDGLPLHVRLISLFHGWLPLGLVWAVRRVGYDRRSLAVQSVVGVTLLATCYAFTPPSRNINGVFGPHAAAAQTAMPPLLWFGLVVTVAVLGLFVPAHLLLRRFARPPEAA